MRIKIFLIFLLFKQIVCGFSLSYFTNMKVHIAKPPYDFLRKNTCFHMSIEDEKHLTLSD